MKLLERMQTKLAQSNEVMTRAGVRLLEGGLPAQNGMRKAIWHCLSCRHGGDCRDWLASGRTQIPPFCPNRTIYERYVRMD